MHVVISCFTDVTLVEIVTFKKKVTELYVICAWVFEDNGARKFRGIHKLRRGICQNLRWMVSV